MEDLIIEQFIFEIGIKFPEISKKFDEWMNLESIEPEDKPYSSLMERFSDATTDAIRNNDYKNARKYLEYMSKKLLSANKIERKYIDTYYVESLMWDDFSGERRRKCWELMPENLQKLYKDFWGRKIYYENNE